MSGAHISALPGTDEELTLANPQLGGSLRLDSTPRSLKSTPSASLLSHIALPADHAPLTELATFSAATSPVPSPKPSRSSRRSPCGRPSLCSPTQRTGLPTRRTPRLASSPRTSTPSRARSSTRRSYSRRFARRLGASRTSSACTRTWRSRSPSTSPLRSSRGSSSPCARCVALVPSSFELSLIAPNAERNLHPPRSRHHRKCPDESQCPRPPLWRRAPQAR